MPLLIPPSVLPLFVEAGWYAERRVALPDALDTDGLQGHPAIHLLETLGGLRVGTCGAGVECATSDIEFGSLEGDLLSWWEEALDTRLVEIAQAHHGHAALYVATDGRWFTWSHVTDLFLFEGSSFEVAVERILRGLRARPLLPSDQEVVMAYGQEYGRTSPEIYPWEQHAT